MVGVGKLVRFAATVAGAALGAMIARGSPAVGAGVGALLGLVASELIDPPPPELVKAVAEGAWAKAMASKYVDVETLKKLAPEKAEEYLREIREYFARRLLSEVYRE